MKTVFAIVFVLTNIFCAKTGATTIDSSSQVKDYFLAAKVAEDTALAKTTLFLKSGPVKVGDTTITLTVMAKNEIAIDINGMSNLVRFPKWMSLTEMIALKADGTRNDNVLSGAGKEYEENGYRHRSTLYISMNADAPKIKSDSVPLAKMIFSINRSYQMLEGDKIYLQIDSVLLTTQLSKLIPCNSPVFLTITVGKPKVDTVPNDTTNHGDTTHVDTNRIDTNGRFNIKLSVDKIGSDEGYYFQQVGKEQLRLKIALQSKAIISNLQLTVTVPDSNFKLLAPVVDKEKIAEMNYMGSGKYRILFSGDTDEHPLLPSPGGAKKTIMTLNFDLSVAPFGPQKIMIEDIAVGSIYEDSTLIINRNTQIICNLNKLFGIRLGEKGDVDYLREWECGNRNKGPSDVKVIKDYVMGIIKLNQYQFWAADLDSNGVVDVIDLTKEQKLVMMSDVDEAVETFISPEIGMIVSNRSFRVIAPNLADGEVVIYNSYGTPVARTNNLDEEISTEYISSGVYMYIISDNTPTGKKLVRTGMVLLYK